jgi:hypothetical protein
VIGIILGTAAAGLLGMLLAVPIAATARELYVRFGSPPPDSVDEDERADDTSSDEDPGERDSQTRPGSLERNAEPPG